MSFQRNIVEPLVSPCQRLRRKAGAKLLLFLYLANFQTLSFFFSQIYYFSFWSASFPTDFTDFTDLFCIFALQNIKITINMKKKNGMKVALASTVMLLMASPASPRNTRWRRWREPEYWLIRNGMHCLMLRLPDLSLLIRVR